MGHSAWMTNLVTRHQGRRLEPRVLREWNICAVRSVMRCTRTNLSCEWVFCLHPPSVVGKFTSRPTETGPISEKIFTNGQTVKNARNSNFLLSISYFRNSWTRTMAAKATAFPALVKRISSLFEGRPYSRILQFLRSVVLFFVLLAGFEEWFYIPAGSLAI